MKLYNSKDKDQTKNDNRLSYIFDRPDPNSIIPKEIKISTPEEVKVEEEVNITEYLSEISANDYGLFTLKVPEDKIHKKEIVDGKKSPNKKITITATPEEDRFFNNSLVKHLIEEDSNFTSEYGVVAKTKKDIISHIAKEDNVYKSLEVVNVARIEKECAKKKEVRYLIIFRKVATP